MQTTEFIWHNNKIVKWADAMTHQLTHTLHYGGGAFEGIRAYKTEKGPAIFRLKEHIDRLLYSSKALNMEIAWSAEEICKATIEVVAKNKLDHGYIRPIVFYGYGVMGLKPFGAPVELSISCWPWGSYLPHETVDVKISKFIRIHPQSTVVDAKLCGHYVNSIMASLELKGTEFHEALLLDASGNIAEGPGENFFMVLGSELHTPAPGSILPGITRDSIKEIAKSKGIKVIERTIEPSEISQASEAFFTGTAAEVTPIRSIDKRLIGDGEPGPITKSLKTTYLDTVCGRDQKFSRFLTYVNSK